MEFKFAFSSVMSLSIQIIIFALISSISLHFNYNNNFVHSLWALFIHFSSVSGFFIIFSFFRYEKD